MIIMYIILIFESINPTTGFGLKKYLLINFTLTVIPVYVLF